MKKLINQSNRLIVHLLFYAALFAVVVDPRIAWWVPRRTPAAPAAAVGSQPAQPATASAGTRSVSHWRKLPECTLADGDFLFPNNYHKLY